MRLPVRGGWEFFIAFPDIPTQPPPCNRRGSACCPAEKVSKPAGGMVLVRFRRNKACRCSQPPGDEAYMKHHRRKLEMYEKNAFRNTERDFILHVILLYKGEIFMKHYLTPSIEVISFNQVDILTASESIDFKSQWLESLGL